MNKTLIICGPTATGKTGFGLKVAHKFSGEIVSADSRQVYEGMDIVTGKDIPYNLKPKTSNLKWRDRYLKYYEVGGIKVWLYDLVNPDEPFNVAFWKECTDLVITDIRQRGKLPVIVGGTGLFIKSLTGSLPLISVPSDPQLRQRLSDKSPGYLFNYLNKLDSIRAAAMNSSDRSNPRRLIRAIEISLNHFPPSLWLREGAGGEFDRNSILNIGLTAPRTRLYRLVDARVESRLAQGAAEEAAGLLKKFGSDLPSLAGSGYALFLSPEDLVTKWKYKEHADVRGQLTWFSKQPNIRRFNISIPDWQIPALKLIRVWYNKKTRH